VPQNPIAAIKAGRYVKGPMLVGNTRDGGKLFPMLLFEATPNAKAISVQ